MREVFTAQCKTHFLDRQEGIEEEFGMKQGLEGARRKVRGLETDLRQILWHPRGRYFTPSFEND